VIVGIKTYTSTRANPLAFVREAYSLYRLKSIDIPGQVNGTIGYMRRCEERIASHIGMRLQGLRLLVIGPGQTPREMVYLGCSNDVVGIDLDVIPHGANPASYLKMLRQNGLMRTLKTVARKGLGIDKRFNHELKRQLGISALPRVSHLQMDAAAMQFPDCSFDFVYSFSVFEHLPDPAKVIDEAVRVLKPGGGCYISLHLYTSEDGCHDLRLFSNNRAEIPYWSHLRPEFEHLIQPNAYLNRVRLHEWKRLFEERMPGVTLVFDCHEQENSARLTKELAALRRQGELPDYSDEELLAVNMIAIWRKTQSEGGPEA
jgi:SAM-dependent methyltransferase